MGFLVWILIVLIVTYIRIVDDCEDFSSKIFVSIIYFSIFARSNLICNIHMKAYEKGKLEKVYTIKGADTTYKWVYREDS